jgi:hypothetical protein
LICYSSFSNPSNASYIITTIAQNVLSFIDAGVAGLVLQKKVCLFLALVDRSQLENDKRDNELEPDDKRHNGDSCKHEKKFHLSPPLASSYQTEVKASNRRGAKRQDLSEKGLLPKCRQAYPKRNWTFLEHSQ